MEALRHIDDWGADHAAVAVLRGPHVLASRGPHDLTLRWASISKPVTALATLVAAEEGVVDLDAPAGPEGSTVRHLLAHASGLPFNGDVPIAPPGKRRIYSNTGYVLLGEVVAAASGMPFAEYMRAAIFEPLGMGAELRGSPAADVHGTLDDLVALAREAQSPTLLAPETAASMRTVQFPGLSGVLPDLGRMEPMDWAFGFEVRGTKHPHWTGANNAPSTYGHFGGSGTFLWVDPDAGLACACLTDREWGVWAMDAWPKLSDAVLAEAS